MAYGVMSSHPLVLLLMSEILHQLLYSAYSIMHRIFLNSTSCRISSINPVALRKAFGTIPEYMYNLACASFAGGEKDSQLS